MKETAKRESHTPPRPLTPSTSPTHRPLGFVRVDDSDGRAGPAEHGLAVAEPGHVHVRAGDERRDHRRACATALLAQQTRGAPSHGGRTGHTWRGRGRASVTRGGNVAEVWLSRHVGLAEAVGG